MARPRQSIDDRIDRLSRWDDDNLHRLWTGAVNENGRPTMKGVRNPVRHLLSLNHPRLRAVPACQEPLCINIHHWKVIQCVEAREGFAPDWTDPRVKTTGFSQIEQEEIDYAVAEFRDSGTFDETYLADHLIEEVRRLTNGSTP